MTAASYTIYGLSVASEIALPELTRLSGAAVSGDDEVMISLASIPPELWADSSEKNGFVVRADGIYFDIPGVARFAIRDGSKIAIEPYPGANEEKIRMYILGSAMGALLHQRGRLPFHSSVIHVNGSGVAFSADSGGGKSTLAALLLQHGHEVAGDDVGALQLTEAGEVLVHSGVNRIRLTAESLEALGGEPTSNGRSGSDDKHLLPCDRVSRLEPVPLRRIYFLEFGERDTLVFIKPISRYDALLELRKNVYRPSLIKGLKREREFFDWATSALSSVEFFRLTRPRDLGRLEEIVDPLEAHFADL